MRKPILVIKGQENGFNYKYVHKAYCMTVTIEFCTDLPRKIFDRIIDKGMSKEEIESFECLGHF